VVIDVNKASVRMPTLLRLINREVMPNGSDFGNYEGTRKDIYGL